MDLEQMAAWIQQVNADPNAHINGVALTIEEQLIAQGQQLLIPEELQTHYIGPQEDFDEECVYE